MPINMRAFEGAEKVTVNRGLDKLPYPKLGSYLYLLDVFKNAQNRKGLDVMVAEFTVVHVFDTEEDHPSHKVGEKLNKVTTQDNDYYVKDCKAIITACTGCSDDQIGQDEILEAFGFDPDGKPLEGGRPLDGQYITVHVQTVEVEKKDGSGTFHVTNFKRGFTSEELFDILPDEVQAKFYTDEEGNNVLEQMVAE